LGEGTQVNNRSVIQRIKIRRSVYLWSPLPCLVIDRFTRRRCFCCCCCWSCRAVVPVIPKRHPCSQTDATNSAAHAIPSYQRRYSDFFRDQMTERFTDHGCDVCQTSSLEQSANFITSTWRPVSYPTRSIAKRCGCFQRRLFVCLSVCFFVCLSARYLPND